MKGKVQDNIIGQETLINEVGNIFKIFKTSEGMIRPHFFVTGGSGSGKTFTIKSLCDSLSLPFVEVNAAQITKEGMSGNSLSKVLAPIGSKGQRPVVVFVDEFDKLFISGNSGGPANESTIGVQNEFLKVLESPTTQVFGDYGKYNTIDISKTLFVFAGAFNNTEDMTLDKLRDFGVKTEFLGRVGLIYNTKPLSHKDLIYILNNSYLLEQYLSLYDNVSRTDVIQAIGDRLNAIEEFNTLGARIINTLIHQYFITGGKSWEASVNKVSFNKKLTFE